MLIRLADRGFKTAQVLGQELTGNQKSLTTRTMLMMTLGLTTILSVLAVASYFNVRMRLEQQTQKRLSQYITERGQRESYIFESIEKNHAQTKQELLSRLQVVNNQDLKPRFDSLFQRRSDGTFRTHKSLLEGEVQAQGRTIRGMAGMLRKDLKLTADRYRQFAIAFDVLSEFGPAWQHKSATFYVLTPDGSSIGFGNAWGLDAPADYPFEQQEWVYGSNPTHNPARKTAWTSLYYDSVAQDYLISILTPIDVEGQHILSIANDLSVGQVIRSSNQDHLDGAYNVILRSDGQVIAHPRLMEKLKEKKGTFRVQDSNDAHLQSIFQKVMAADPKERVLDAENEFLAIAKIQGPDWYFVTVYSKHLLNSDALNIIQYIVTASIAALIVQVALLLFVLRTQIMQPLQQLLSATKRLTSGDFGVYLNTGRQDELGQLAIAFNDMTARLNQSFLDLEVANAELEDRVTQRTVELKDALYDLQQTQIQMLQSEKMSALGQMVAGVAHEINNPVNFIHGNLPHLTHYTQDLLRVVQLYQQHCLAMPDAVQAALDEIDLEFVAEDSQKILNSMTTGTVRIRDIVRSLRNFSRLDESDLKLADLNEGLESTLLILQHRLTADSIQVMRHYGSLPQVQCYAGQLNQVFMNLLANAIDALEQAVDPTIWITTTADEAWVQISIRDNGCGIVEAVRSQIFNPFFTTKEVGKGTGLGLAISYQIVIDRHCGHLICESTPGVGTEFIVKIPARDL